MFFKRPLSKRFILNKFQIAIQVPIPYKTNIYAYSRHTRKSFNKKHSDVLVAIGIITDFKYSCLIFQDFFYISILSDAYPIRERLTETTLKADCWSQHYSACMYVCVCVSLMATVFFFLSFLQLDITYNQYVINVHSSLMHDKPSPLSSPPPQFPPRGAKSSHCPFATALLCLYPPKSVISDLTF